MRHEAGAHRLPTPGLASRVRPSQIGRFRGLREGPLHIHVALVVALLCAACERHGAPFDCQCDMLTDYDDGWKLPARVCAEDAREAPAIARGCAQVGAPAPVQSCTCAPAASAVTPCRHGCRE